jgi:iron complex transport system ATP-binding protein
MGRFSRIFTNSPAVTVRTPILEVSNLRIHRGSVQILKDISWRVSSGEHWAVLGANGSGKTSLLSALTGYLTPSAGEVVLLGQRYGGSDWRELRKKIGLVSSSVRRMMPQDEPALELVLSGKDAMIGFLGPSAESDRRRAARILRQVKCSHIARQRWEILSQGERQRVLIGRSLMARPRVLILDEPCAGLDPAAREHFLQFLERLGHQKRSPTLVLVTHHVEEIMPIFSHVLVLSAGAVLAAGVKEKVLTGSILSKAFKASMKLGKAKGRYSLRLLARSETVM